MKYIICCVLVMSLLMSSTAYAAEPAPGPNNGLLTKSGEILDPKHTALLIVDMQNDFAHQPGAEIVPNINRLITSARLNGVLVVYVGLVHSLTTDSPSYMARYAKRGLDPKNLLVQEGTVKTDWVPGLLRPLPTEQVVYKYGYDAFQDTKLGAFLRNRGIRSLVITGANTNLCVESTAFRAFAEGYYVTLPEDGVASYDRAVHRIALENMSKYVADTTPSQQIIELWNMIPNKIYQENVFYPTRTVPPIPARIGPVGGILVDLDKVVKPEHTALLVVDMQDDFVGVEGRTAASGTNVQPVQQTIPVINSLIRSARENGVDVIYVKLEHSVVTDSPNYMARYSRRGLSPGNLLVKSGTPGADFVEGLLKPIDGERTVIKYGYDAFTNTDLQALLKNRGIKSLVVTGVNTNLCVQATVLRAFAEGYYTVVPKDAVASTDAELHAYALNNFDRFFSLIPPAADVMKAWSTK